MENPSFEHREALSVRLVRADEVARFNALLDEHHFLGHHLFGRVLRYVAVIDEEWAALLGFGSAALSLGSRERYVGWSEEVKLRRLRYVLNNQRFCVLPDARRPNLASAVLSRTLSRLSTDVRALYGHPVVLVETFTDPALHRGTCYRAANFTLVGETSGYGRRNGAWVHHGNKKLCWLYPLRRDARMILAAPFEHPALSGERDKEGQVVDLNQVVIEGRDGLYERLCSLPDHRKAKGVRHELGAILLVCVAAMCCRNHNPTEIAEWAADLGDDLKERLHMRRSPSTGRLVAPSLSTIQRTLREVDRNVLDQIVTQVMAEQVARRWEEGAEQLDGCDNDRGGEGDDVEDEEDEEDGDTLKAIAVDGKSLRGAVQDDGRCIHLFSAMTHGERVVIAQEEVDHKTNEITALRPLFAERDISGCIVTADAMHAQRDHATFLVEEKHAGFLLFVKENQPKLFDAIASLPEEKWSEPSTERCKGHGRVETRTIQVAPVPDDLPDFPYVAQIVRIIRAVDDPKTTLNLCTLKQRHERQHFTQKSLLQVKEGSKSHYLSYRRRKKIHNINAA